MIRQLIPKINHRIIFTIIPLVISFQICPYLKNDIVLVSPAINNSGMLAYNAIEPIFCSSPSLCIQTGCFQNRSYPTLIVRYNANKVPIIRKEPIIFLRCISDLMRSLFRLIFNISSEETC